MAPDDVVEDVTDVLGLIERRDDGADRVGADLVAVLDELDELVDALPAPPRRAPPSRRA